MSDIKDTRPEAEQQQDAQACENQVTTRPPAQEVPPRQPQESPPVQDADEPAPQQTEEPAAKSRQESSRSCACNSLFAGLAAIGPLALLLILGCMAWPMFWHPGQGFYCPAELKSLTAFLHCIAQQSWIAPTGLENSAFSAPQWPVFNIWIGLFALVPGLADSGLLLPAATFTATFLAAFAVWALAISAGFGRKAALAAGIILLCAPVFAPLPHFMGPAALAAALAIFAIIFFCRGWMAEKAWLCLPLAFVLTALAGLCGGLLHFAVPLLASFCFLIWRANLHRAQRADALSGFILMLVIIGCWLGAIMLSDGHENYVNALFAGAARFAWPIPTMWLAAIAISLAGLIPWLLMVFGVSWLHVLTHAGSSLSASRHANGSAFVWISLVLTLCLSLFTPAFHAAAILIVCLAAALLGKTFINLPDIGNRLFFALAGFCMLAAGAIICLASYSETQPLVFNHIPLLANIPGLGVKLAALSALPVIGGICILAGLLAFFFAKRCRACGGLVFAALTVIVLCQPARLMLVPEIAALPGTPLMSYASIEGKMKAALAPAQTAQPSAENPAQARQTAPAPVPAEPQAKEPAQTEPVAEAQSQPEAAGQPKAVEETVKEKAAAPETVPQGQANEEKQAQ